MTGPDSQPEPELLVWIRCSSEPLSAFHALFHHVGSRGEPRFTLGKGPLFASGLRCARANAGTQGPSHVLFLLTYGECKYMRESVEPYDTLPCTYHLASTMNNSWLTWLPLNRPLPLFLPQIPGITSFHPCIFFSKDLKRVNKHHRNSIILLEKVGLPPQSGPRSYTCVGEAVAYLCSQRHPQEADDIHILR